MQFCVHWYGTEPGGPGGKQHLDKRVAVFHAQDHARAGRKMQGVQQATGQTMHTLCKLAIGECLFTASQRL